MFKKISEIYDYREMIKNSVRKELRARYKGSVLGFFWTFLNPLLMLIVYSIVFSHVMRVNVPNYSYTLFLFIGLVPWLFFSVTIQQGATVILSNSNLIKKIFFPRIILPISVVLTNLANMLFTFVIIFAALFYCKVLINFNLLYLPIIVIVQALLVLGFTVILSSITVYFRDLEHIINVVLMAWMYMTPVFYPMSYVPKELLPLFNLNPMMPIINAYRNILLFAKQPDLNALFYVLIFSIILLFASYCLFEKLQKRFAEEI